MTREEFTEIWGDNAWGDQFDKDLEALLSQTRTPEEVREKLSIMETERDFNVRFNTPAHVVRNNDVIATLKWFLKETP